MWISILPGVAVGVFQVYAMGQYVKALGQRQVFEQQNLSSDAPEWAEYRRGSRKRLIMALINVALIIGLLFGLGAWGAEALMWGAGGLCGSMIIFSLVAFIKQM